MAAQPPHQPPHDGGAQRPGAPPTDADQAAASMSVSVDKLAGQLPAVVFHGLHKSSADVLRGLFALGCVQDRASDGASDQASDDVLVRGARGVVHDALGTLGDGPYGQAARLLFGDNDDTRGQKRRVRRRLAAYQIDVMSKWFAVSYEPQIVRDVAGAIFDMEHAHRASNSTAVVRASDDAGAPEGADTATAIAPVDGADQPDDDQGDAQGDGQGDNRGGGEQGTGRSRRRRVLRWLRPPAPEHAAAVILASAPHASFTSSQPQQLFKDLQRIRDQQAKRQWYLAFALGGVVVVWRYGFDAAPRYVLVLAILGVGKTANDMFTEWRATRSVKLYEQWPRIVMLVMTVFLAGGMVVEQGDDNGQHAREAEAARRAGCQLQFEPDEYCRDVLGLAEAEISDSGCPTEENGAPAIVELFDDERREKVFSDIGVSDPVPMLEPPTCIGTGTTYLAQVETMHGTFVVELDTTAGPIAANNFVFLSRWNYYDWTTVDFREDSHELRSGDLIVGMGEPEAPGYELPLERPPAPQPNETAYPPYTIGYVNGLIYGQTSHAGQFFIILPEADTAGMGNDFTRFGRITSGIDVISAITALGSTIIYNITIDEQPHNDEERTTTTTSAD